MFQLNSIFLSFSLFGKGEKVLRAKLNTNNNYYNNKNKNIATITTTQLQYCNN